MEEGGDQAHDGEDAPVQRGRVDRLVGLVDQGRGQEGEGELHAGEREEEEQMHQVQKGRVVCILPVFLAGVRCRGLLSVFA